MGQDYRKLEAADDKLQFAIKLISQGEIRRGVPLDTLKDIFGDDLVKVDGNTPEGYEIFGVVFRGPPKASDKVRQSRQARIDAWYLTLHVDSDHSDQKVVFYYLTNVPK